MIKCAEFGNKEFASKEEMFAALKRNEDQLIGIKRAKIYKSAEKDQITFLNLKQIGSAKAAFDLKEGYIYPVISTTRYMDSHSDVHFDGCFGKTCKEQQGRVYYALDHELKWDSVLTWPKDVKMFISPVEWALVGKSYPGQTEGLIFEISKDKFVRKEVLKAIEDLSSDFENSIRMTYEKIVLGINSTDKDMASNKAYFDSRISSIANKEVALEQGYFWGVEELRIHKEGSLVIAGGSNDATGIILPEADQFTFGKTDPALTSQPVKTILNILAN